VRCAYSQSERGSAGESGGVGRGVTKPLTSDFRAQGIWACHLRWSQVDLSTSDLKVLSISVPQTSKFCRLQYLRPQSSVDFSTSDLKVLSTSVPQTSKFCRPQYLRPQSSVDFSTSDLKVLSTSIPQTSKFCLWATETRPSTCAGSTGGRGLRRRRRRRRHRRRRQRCISLTGRAPTGASTTVAVEGRITVCAVCAANASAASAAVGTIPAA